MDMETTCGNCPHVCAVGLRNPIIGCELEGFVIPHHVDYTKESGQVTFWRVPLFCPRPDSEVKKGKKQAPKKEWVVKSISDINLTDDDGGDK